MLHSSNHSHNCFMPPLLDCKIPSVIMFKSGLLQSQFPMPQTTEDNCPSCWPITFNDHKVQMGTSKEVAFSYSEATSAPLSLPFLEFFCFSSSRISFGHQAVTNHRLTLIYSHNGIFLSLDISILHLMFCQADIKLRESQLH